MKKRIVTFMFLLILLGMVVNIFPAEADSYILGPGDLLEIVLWGRVNQKFSAVVNENGLLELNLIGSVNAEGMTIDQLTEVLTAEFSKYVKEPNIIVTLTRARQLNVIILGSIRTPGAYSFPAGTTLVQALIKAGNPTDQADLAAITIKRNGETIVVNMAEFTKDPITNSIEDVQLQNGDSIIIPSAMVSIAVLGEVNRPGVYQIPKGGSLFEAVTAAGGFSREAVTGRITVYEAQDLAADAPTGKEIYKGGLEGNLRLQHGQVVFVPRNYFWDIGIVVSLISVLTGIKSLIGL